MKKHIGMDSKWSNVIKLAWYSYASGIMLEVRGKTEDILYFTQWLANHGQTSFNWDYPSDKVALNYVEKFDNLVAFLRGKGESKLVAMLQSSFCQTVPMSSNTLVAYGSGMIEPNTVME